mgnify:CR=1 FL=1
MVKKIALGLKGNSICTLDHEDFDWETFLKKLAEQGLEVVRTENLWCG